MTAPIEIACRHDGLAWGPLYDGFVARLRAAGVAEGTPRVGDRFADFALPDARGRTVALADLLARGPLVLSFNRGAWCPYCMGELSSWSQRAPALRRAGGRFVSVAGEVGGRAARLEAVLGPDAAVLCDVDHGLALAVGLAFRCDDEVQRRYLACGLDLAEVYGTSSGFLPVPATYVLDTDGVVRFALADPDFRVRASPDRVIAVVRDLVR